MHTRAKPHKHADAPVGHRAERHTEEENKGVRATESTHIGAPATWLLAWLLAAGLEVWQFAVV